MGESKGVIRTWTGDVATACLDASMVVEECGLRMGQLYGSKSLYVERHPGHKVFFNANLFNSSGLKIWWGDLDLNREAEKLICAAEKLEEPLLAAYEHMRWEGARISAEALRDAIGFDGFGAVARVKGEAKVILGQHRHPLVYVVLPGEWENEEEALKEAEKTLGRLLDSN